ncbi:MAG: fatty acid desaturase [Anaerolineaceae bacterium]|nr:MAG: fatty acid desaturase [Anaerolineaceae bacterium]
MNSTTRNRTKRGKPDWVDLVKPYKQPDTKKSVWQLGNTVTLLVLSWAAMYWSLAAGFWWVTLILAPITAGFCVRLFIIQHDCGHGSFFKSRKANDRLGTLTSIVTLTPYAHWRRRHAIHHANSGNSDESFIGDVPTLTVEEYLEKDIWGRLQYRLFRHPIILFIIVPFVLFFIVNRFPASTASKKERRGVYWTNAAIAVLWTVLIVLFGWQAFLLVYLLVGWLAAIFGMWLFFVQHQFEDTYWERQEDWDFTLAGMQGSSYYKLPRVLQWFTGNIGFHHIHHLSPRIPNYKLEKCHDENPIFQNVQPITLRASLHASFLSLWDKKQKKLISFRQLQLKQRAEMGV